MRWWLAMVLAVGCVEPGGGGGGGNDSGTDTETTTISAGIISNLTWTQHTFAASLFTASWTQSEDATIHLEFSVDEGVWQSTPSRAFRAGDNTQLIAGIPYDTVAQWRLVIEQGGATVDGKPITGPNWPSALPRPELTVSEPEGQLADGKYLLYSMNQFDGGWTGGAYWTLIVDRQGRLIWAKRTPNKAWTLFAQVSQAGDSILWDEQLYWPALQNEGLASKVHSTYLDAEIEVIATPGLHHEFVQLPDGTLAWGSQCHGGGEALVQLAPDAHVPDLQPGADCPEPGVGEPLWTCTATWGSGGCESNGMFYNEPTDTFLYSFYTNSTLVELERSTGDTLWWAGQQNGGWDFSPPSSQFFWQHGVSYTDAGTLLVSSEYTAPGQSERTWVLEYNVNTATQELELVWSNSSGVLAQTNGQAWRLANGNTLHLVGSAGVIREVGAGDADVWRLEYGDDYLLGHGELIEDLYDLVSPANKGTETTITD
jgi:Arylsulfotransferase (ASST)